MSDWSPKQLAMQLLCSDPVVSPEQAIATALKFERLWGPEQARLEAERAAFSGRLASLPEKATEEQTLAWLAQTRLKMKEKGEKAWLMAQEKP